MVNVYLEQWLTNIWNIVTEYLEHGYWIFGTMVNVYLEQWLTNIYDMINEIFVNKVDRGYCNIMNNYTQPWSRHVFYV